MHSRVPEHGEVGELYLVANTLEFSELRSCNGGDAIKRNERKKKLTNIILEKKLLGD